MNFEYGLSQENWDKMIGLIEEKYRGQIEHASKRETYNLPDGSTATAGVIYIYPDKIDEIDTERVGSIRVGPHFPKRNSWDRVKYPCGVEITVAGYVRDFILTRYPVTKTGLKTDKILERIDAGLKSIRSRRVQIETEDRQNNERQRQRSLMEAELTAAGKQSWDRYSIADELTRVGGPDAAGFYSGRLRFGALTFKQIETIKTHIESFVQANKGETDGLRG